jgi:hypothetical protein
MTWRVDTKFDTLTLASIRAYGAQLAFREESYKRINRYSKAGRSFYNMNR